jgi:hypothetical protein
MIHRSVKMFKRKTKTWPGCIDNAKHVEHVKRVTWRVFFVPVFMLDEVTATDMS